MALTKDFYCKSKEKNSIEKPVFAPLMRKCFSVEKLPKNFTVSVCGLGVYELFFNGKRVTKGYLAPYRSNPDHFLYYDEYDLTSKVKLGKNAISLTLGNGFNNSVSITWNFCNNTWNSSPKFALSAEFDGTEIFSAKDFKCADSEVTFDDFHCGEHIDANLIKKGWTLSDFDDSDWASVIKADTPKGELTLCTAEPIKPTEYLKPVKIIKGKNGYIYDFGESSAGTYNLKISGKKGQEIRLTATDCLYEDGAPVTWVNACLENRRDGYIQCDWLTLSGERIDEFEPRFTYKGFRFIEITGITSEQAYALDITYIKLASSFSNAGTFECDNEIINAIFKLTKNSNWANFFYFPTDCPQREKNGWTGDAVLSADQFMYNLDCANSLTVWLENIVKAQRDDGALPGIVPTNDWGYIDWSGPSWDGVIFELPYRIYTFTGETKAIEICADAMVKYLKFMETFRDEKGLLDYGLGDYLSLSMKTPNVNTTTIMCKYLAEIGAKCLKIIGRESDAEYAENLSNSIRNSFRKHCLWNNTNSLCDTQTDQAMAMHYGMIDSKDLPRSVKRLKEYIHYLSNDDIDVGILGHRVIYRALIDNGEHDYALSLIIGDKAHSYKTAMLDIGATTLIEEFPQFSSPLWALKYDDERLHSFNHHFRGDVTAIFYRYITGMRIDEPNKVNFAPLFFKEVNYAKATHKYKTGELKIEMKKINDSYHFTLFVPSSISVLVTAPQGYKADNYNIKTGENTVVFTKI